MDTDNCVLLWISSSFVVLVIQVEILVFFVIYTIKRASGVLNIHTSLIHIEQHQPIYTRFEWTKLLPHSQNKTASTLNAELFFFTVNMHS